jgi:hypothetical protein
MYDELKSNIYDDVVAFLDRIGLDEGTISNLCDVIDGAFDRTFFAAAPITLDLPAQN